MTEKPDPRLHAYRDDLADSRLKETIHAQSYTDGFLAQCRCDKSGLRRTPDKASSLDSEILLGEWVRIFEWGEQWCWLQSLEDGYVGYAPSGDFVESYPANRQSMIVDSAQSLLFPEADIKTPPIMTIYAGTRIDFVADRGKFVEVSLPGQLHTCFALKSHMRTTYMEQGDLSLLPSILYGFLETPYLWGGRTRAGIDCSGLVQQAFFMAGFPLPLRDTYMQESSMGMAIPHDEGLRKLRLGDIVFWPGHVGIMLDDIQLMHANATDMKVAMVPLMAVEEHILAMENNPISTIRRMNA